MADVRPFRGLRYDAALATPALNIAPPYDVISPEQQAALYERSAHNVVRIEYGEQRPDDSAAANRYTRAASDLDAWCRAGVLVRDEQPAIYAYRQEFEWDGRRHARAGYFAAVRLEEWEEGVIKPHEHTLSGPKADRLELLRATRTQVSPVYCVFRARAGAPAMPPMPDEPLYDFEADGQRHVLSAVRDGATLRGFATHLDACDVYIADGHHRYETALNYRNEVRARAAAWTGEEPENFVLMALTDAADPGLLVLPTHRVVNPPSAPPDAFARIARFFEIEDIAADGDPGGSAALASLLHRLEAADRASTVFGAAGLKPGALQLLSLRDRAGIEALMPAVEPAAWKRLDVSVLQFGILEHVFGIDAAALAAGGALTYTQDPRDACAAVDAGRAKFAFLLNPTPVEQVLAVADAGGRMPQKSTYFHPKLPTGLVMNSLAP
jgi:uncharacterized protein (DUF1015 family)